MTNEKLLEKIGDIVDKRVTQSETKLEKRLTEIVDKRATKTEKRLQGLEGKFERLEGKFEDLEIKMEHRFNAVDKELKAIRKQQDEDREDWTGFFQETGIFIEELRKKLMKRIERIENHLGFTNN